MSKAIIVPDLAYTSPKGRRGGSSTGARELNAKLKYFQFRQDRDGHIPQEEGKERWVDRGLGQNYRDILKNCQRLSSDKVLAWTLVVSPAPDLMALVPADERLALVMTLTEQIVETYYTQREVDVPEFSYVVHDRLTKADDDHSEGLQQLHTHSVLPGTVPTLEGAREAFYNRSSKGHVELLRSIATEHFEAALDRNVGPEWRGLRPERDVPLSPVIEPMPGLAPEENGTSELDRWFGSRSLDIT